MECIFWKVYCFFLTYFSLRPYTLFHVTLRSITFISIVDRNLEKIWRHLQWQLVGNALVTTAIAGLVGEPVETFYAHSSYIHAKLKRLQQYNTSA